MTAEKGGTRKTGGGGGQWVEYDSPKPPAVADHYTFWLDPPPSRSDRCAWWERQIARGWRPSRRVAREGYDASAQWFGVWLWEYLNVLVPAMSEPVTPAAETVVDAVTAAEAEALAAHRAGTCSESPWSCSHCEAEGQL